jgi:hypothetical protein
MLLAEIHGKSLASVPDNEDYLTSTVFGHLRYLPPSVFWPELFAKVRGLPDANGREPSLADFLARSGISPARSDSLTVRFWPAHSRYGEPDLLLQFTGGGQA